jgi:chromosome segregation ATPase
MEKEQLFNQHTTEYGRMSKLFETSRRVLEDLKAKADEAAPLQAEDGSDLPLKKLLDDLPVETREETEAALEEAEAKANSIIADPNVVRHYEERKKEIEKVQADLDDLTSAKEGKLTELEQKRKPWEDALTNSVDKVDLLFTKYMAELGCTGEVKLVKGEESEHADGMGSFRDWGIEIRVAFRNNTKPQVLSARVQSGGERSVSTIMYLMALQEMMVAPFRCVDEINQGLDDRNERLVFKRIVENSTKPPGPGGLTDHCGQYFLITPKLLPNLYDMEEEAMTLLFIFNGMCPLDISGI